jgi:hypothetical protein
VGCTAPYRHAQLRPDGASFGGIDAVLQNPDESAAHNVDVLLIHGMGTHTSDWALALIGQVASALGFHRTESLPDPQTLANGALDAVRQEAGFVMWCEI